MNFRTVQSLPTFPSPILSLSHPSLPTFLSLPFSPHSFPPPPFPSPPFFFHLFPHSSLHHPSPTPSLSPPLNIVRGLESAESSPSRSGMSPATKRLVVHFELKIVLLWWWQVFTASQFADFLMCVSTKISNFSSIFTRVQYIVDPRNTIFARVRIPGPAKDQRLWLLLLLLLLFASSIQWLICTLPGTETWWWRVPAFHHQLCDRQFAQRSLLCHSSIRRCFLALCTTTFAPAAANLRHGSG